MSNLKEMIQEKEQLENEIDKILRPIFKRLLDTGVMQNDWERYKSYDPRNANYTGYTSFANTLHLKGDNYAGGGEYENIHANNIEYEEIENIDLYINRKCKEISDRELAEKEKERLAEEKSNADQEIWEREQYENLKKKFGDA